MPRPSWKEQQESWEREVAFLKGQIKKTSRKAYRESLEERLKRAEYFVKYSKAKAKQTKPQGKGNPHNPAPARKKKPKKRARPNRFSVRCHSYQGGYLLFEGSLTRAEADKVFAKCKREGYSPVIFDGRKKIK
jgi:hypothetical protein